ncbi:MAG: hypothetical protein Q7S61_00390 [bacterium]|nr:hypothetical protein [bacterium]
MNTIKLKSGEIVTIVTLLTVGIVSLSSLIVGKIAQNSPTINTRAAVFCNDPDRDAQPYSVKTTVEDNNGKYADECINKNELREYSCSNNVGVSERVWCDKGCVSEACSATQVTPTPKVQTSPPAGSPTPGQTLGGRSFEVRSWSCNRQTQELEVEYYTCQKVNDKLEMNMYGLPISRDQIKTRERFAVDPSCITGTMKGPLSTAIWNSNIVSVDYSFNKYVPDSGKINLSLDRNRCLGDVISPSPSVTTVPNVTATLSPTPRAQVSTPTPGGGGEMPSCTFYSHSSIHLNSADGPLAADLGFSTHTVIKEKNGTTQREADIAHPSGQYTVNGPMYSLDKQKCDQGNCRSADVALMNPKNLNIVGTFCTNTGNGGLAANCNKTSAQLGSNANVMWGFNIVCGAHYDYGWIIKSPPTGSVKSTVTVNGVIPNGYHLILSICNKNNKKGCDSIIHSRNLSSTSTWTFTNLDLGNKVLTLDHYFYPDPDSNSTPLPFSYDYIKLDNCNEVGDYSTHCVLNIEENKTTEMNFTVTIPSATPAPDTSSLPTITDLAVKEQTMGERGEIPKCGIVKMYWKAPPPASLSIDGWEMQFYNSRGPQTTRFIPLGATCYGCDNGAGKEKWQTEVPDGGLNRGEKCVFMAPGDYSDTDPGAKVTMRAVKGSSKGKETTSNNFYASSIHRTYPGGSCQEQCGDFDNRAVCKTQNGTCTGLANCPDNQQFAGYCGRNGATDYGACCIVATPTPTAVAKTPNPSPSVPITSGAISVKGLATNFNSTTPQYIAFFIANTYEDKGFTNRYFKDPQINQSYSYTFSNLDPNKEYDVYAYLTNAKEGNNVIRDYKRIVSICDGTMINGETGYCRIRPNKQAVEFKFNPIDTSKLSNLGGSCSSDGKQVTLRWNKVDNIDNYLLRVDNLADKEWHNCSPINGDFCVDDLSSSIQSYTFDSKPGTTYAWWVHTVKNGVVGPKIDGPPITCPITSPTPSGPTAKFNFEIKTHGFGTKESQKPTVIGIQIDHYDGSKQIADENNYSVITNPEINKTYNYMSKQLDSSKVYIVLLGICRKNESKTEQICNEALGYQYTITGPDCQFGTSTSTEWYCRPKNQTLTIDINQIPANGFNFDSTEFASADMNGDGNVSIASDYLALKKECKEQSRKKDCGKIASLIIKYKGQTLPKKLFPTLLPEMNLPKE